MNIHPSLISIKNRQINTSFFVGKSLLGRLHEIEQIKSKNYSSFLVIADSVTVKLFGDKLTKSLYKLSKPVHVSIIPAGEKAKNLASLADYLKPFFNKGLTRKSVLVALGGGVVCDIGGFIASILLRGIESIYIPTTLLAQIDAGIGGKTGVDYWINKQSMYKNMIGTFHMPTIVVSDINVLTTLPKREITSGLGEIAKYWVGWGNPTVNQMLKIRNLLDTDNIINVISVCQEIKLEIVKKDPFELSGQRQKLNLGHTIGHGIESAAKGKISHGQAVAIGLVGAAKISTSMKLLKQKVADEIELTIRSLGLPVRATGVNPDNVLESMKIDKKGGTFVLINGIGKILSGMKVERKIFENVVKEVCL